MPQPCFNNIFDRVRLKLLFQSLKTLDNWFLIDLQTPDIPASIPAPWRSSLRRHVRLHRLTRSLSGHPTEMNPDDRSPVLRKSP